MPEKCCNHHTDLEMTRTKKGHLYCKQCCKEKRELNKERILEYGKRYREQHREENVEYQRAYREENKETLLAKTSMRDVPPRDISLIYCITRRSYDVLLRWFYDG